MQGTQSWSPSQQHNVSVGYDATVEHSMQVLAQDRTAVPGQPISLQDILSPLSLTSPVEYPSMIQEQEAMALLDQYYSHQDMSDIESADIINDVLFHRNVYAQSGDDLLSLRIPTYGLGGPPTSPTGTDPSPQTPLEPYVARYFSSQESPGIELLDTAGQLLPFEDSHPEDVYIPAAFLHTSWNVNDSSSQSPVKPSASPPVIKVEDVEELKAVGSAQIQQAANKRRTKEGNIKCQFFYQGCKATFTARHNLRYHINAHLGLKPYKCGKCTYAASSPATMKRHQSTCKGTIYSTKPDA